MPRCRHVEAWSRRTGNGWELQMVVGEACSVWQSVLEFSSLLRPEIEEMILRPEVPRLLAAGGT
jgi:hypothetical protein